MAPPDSADISGETAVGAGAALSSCWIRPASSACYTGSIVPTARGCTEALCGTLRATCTVLRAEGEMSRARAAVVAPYSD